MYSLGWSFIATYNGYFLRPSHMFVISLSAYLSSGHFFYTEIIYLPADGRAAKHGYPRGGPDLGAPHLNLFIRITKIAAIISFMTTIISQTLVRN